MMAVFLIEIDDDSLMINWCSVRVSVGVFVLVVQLSECGAIWNRYVNPPPESRVVGEPGLKHSWPDEELPMV